MALSRGERSSGLTEPCGDPGADTDNRRAATLHHEARRDGMAERGLRSSGLIERSLDPGADMEQRRERAFE